MSSGGSYRKWTVATGNPVGQREFGYGNAYAISPDCRTLAVASTSSGSTSDPSEGKIDLVDLETGASLIRLHQFHDERTWLAEAIDGSINASKDLLRFEQLALDGLNLTHSPQFLERAFACIRPAALIPESLHPPPKGSRLFVLPVGISKYKYDEYDLRFAANDAEQVDDFFRLQKGRGFADVVTQLCTDEKASRDNVETQLNWLKESCTADDVAVILFSGHGIVGRNGLYFVTHDGDEEGIQYTCVNWTRVVNELSQTEAKTIVFFADCCHAGAFAEERRPTQTQFAKLFAEKKGLFLYCSSTGAQVSRELPHLRHGVFTYAVLEGLKGLADRNDDRRVTIAELRAYVDVRVDKLSNGKQTPSVPFPNNYDPHTILSVVPKGLNDE